MGVKVVKVVKVVKGGAKRRTNPNTKVVKSRAKGRKRGAKVVVRGAKVVVRGAKVVVRDAKKVGPPPMRRRRRKTLAEMHKCRARVQRIRQCLSRTKVSQRM